MKKGFSLTTLIITIIVMIVIATTIILSTEKISGKSEAMIILDEMKILQGKIYEYQLKHEDDVTRYEYIGSKDLASTGNIASSITLGSITYGEGDYEGYYLLTPSHMKKIDITNIDNTYLVNYVTQDIVYIEGIEINDVMYYSIDDIDKQANVLQD